MRLCRLCGDNATRAERTAVALQCTGLDQWPDWLEGFCMECVCASTRDIDVDDGESLTPEVFDAFVAREFYSIAHRFSRGMSLDKCEAVGLYSYTTERHDGRCSRYANRERDGHKLCHWHAKDYDAGKKLAFKDGEFEGRPFLIWARSAEELENECALVAAKLRAGLR